MINTYLLVYITVSVVSAMCLYTFSFCFYIPQRKFLALPMAVEEHRGDWPVHQIPNSLRKNRQDRFDPVTSSTILRKGYDYTTFHTIKGMYM